MADALTGLLNDCRTRPNSHWMQDHGIPALLDMLRTVQGHVDKLKCTCIPNGQGGQDPDINHTCLIHSGPKDESGFSALMDTLNAKAADVVDHE